MRHLVENAIDIDNLTLFSNILDDLPVGVYATDTQRRIFYWNKKAEEITGYAAYEIIGKSCFTSNLNHKDNKGTELCKLSCPLFDSICNGDENMAHVLVQHKSGIRIPIVVTTFPIHGKDGNIIGGYEIFYIDDTPCRCQVGESDIHNKDFYDILTGLPNKKFVTNFINYKIMEYEKFGRPFALLFGNLDNFTTFNSKYGTENGDKILINIAGNIRKNCRKADLVGRWESDTFAGVFNMVDSTTGHHVGEKFFTWIDNSDIEYNGEQVGVTTSTGVAIVRPADTVDKLINRVKEMVKEAKKTKNDIVTDF